jgi:hypothetical protein
MSINFLKCIFKVFYVNTLLRQLVVFLFLIVCRRNAADDIIVYVEVFFPLHSIFVNISRNFRSNAFKIDQNSASEKSVTSLYC